jgi:hypothetical protein
MFLAVDNTGYSINSSSIFSESTNSNSIKSGYTVK